MHKFSQVLLRCVTNKRSLSPADVVRSCSKVQGSVTALVMKLCGPR